MITEEGGQAIAILEVRGYSDFHHPRETTEAVHELIPGSRMAEPPSGDREWLERLAASARGERIREKSPRLSGA